MPNREIAIVAGVGPGLGSAICTELCAAGYHVAAIARNKNYLTELADTLTATEGALTPVTCDLLDPTSVDNAFARIKELEGAISVYVHNASRLVMEEFLNLSAQSFEELWRLTCFSAFQCAQKAIPEMQERKSGTIIFTGATASVRGGANFAAFACAKFALRGLAQSLAREFGPKGIHVAHVVIDGIIDTQWTRDRFGIEPAKALVPEEIAKSYLHLIKQHRSAWTHELDLRPDVETF